MGAYKENHGKTKIGSFLQSIGQSDILDRVVNAAGDFITGDTLGAIQTLIVGSKTMSDEEKLTADAMLKIDQSELKAFELEIKDRESAREMYKDDNLIQKVFAIVFLVGYGYMCWYMLNLIRGASDDSDLFKTMITMIFTSTSMKLNTIIDFLFGGSMKGK